MEAQFLHRFAEKFMRNLLQYTYTVSDLAVCVLAGPVLQLFHNVKRIIKNTMIRMTVNIDNHADTAGVMFVLYLLIRFVIALHIIPPKALKGREA